MAAPLKTGCTTPIGGPGSEERKTATVETTTAKEERSMIQVGKKVPDFTARAYHKGQFTQVTLSEHLGKWVVLCFYPGDFTFV